LRCQTSHKTFSTYSAKVSKVLASFPSTTCFFLKSAMQRGNKMRYNKIRKMDISNGPGVRVSIFMQGCTFNCKECFNPETHDFEGGKEFNEETIDRVIELCKNENINGLSILGGEPLHPKNVEGTTKLVKTFKEKLPDKSVWIWSGFSFDGELKDKEVMKYTDVLVDGRYVDELRNPTLKWRGSENQRVIDVQKSLNNSNIIFYDK